MGKAGGSFWSGIGPVENASQSFGCLAISVRDVTVENRAQCRFEVATGEGLKALICEKCMSLQTLHNQLFPHVIHGIIPS